MPDELVVLQPNNAALAEAVVSSSWGDDDEDEVKPRYIKLKQAKSKDLDEFTTGHFVDKAVGRSWETLRAVILNVKLTRKFQSPYNPTKQSTLFCRSANRKTPVTTDDRFVPKANDCASCAYGQRAWAHYNKKTGEGKPQNPCEQEVEVLFIDQANPKQPYIYVATGRSRDVIEAMYTKLKTRSKDVLDTTGRRPELYEYVVTLTTQRGEGRAAEFFYPYVSQIEELDKDQAAEEFGEAYEQFVLARRAAYEQARQDQEVQQEVEAPQQVVEVAAKPATKPVIDAAFIPPPSRRVAGTRPVYKPPTASVTVEAQLEPEVDPTEPQVTI